MKRGAVRPVKCYAAVRERPTSGNPYIACVTVAWSAKEAREKLTDGFDDWVRCYRDGWRVRRVYVSLEKPE